MQPVLAATKHRPSRRVAGEVVAAAIALAVIVVLVWGGGGGRRVHADDRGPLQGGADDWSSIPADIGQGVTYGGAGALNESNKTAVLEAARVRPPLPDGVELLGVQAVGPDSDLSTVYSELAYPSPYLAEGIHDVAGTRLAPANTREGHYGVRIVIGLKATKPGTYGFAQVELDYRIGKKEYTVRLDHGFILCAPRSDNPNGCDEQTLEEDLSKAAGRD